jgi:hypothetical protein
MIDAATAISCNVPAANEIRVAFLGNSIQYFNDCPRLLEHMLQTKYSNGVYQDSCFRGGASLASLWKNGNGMREKFGQSELAKRSDGSVDIGAETVAKLLGMSNNAGYDRTTVGSVTAHWDYVVLNDYTQGPARLETRAETIEALGKCYGPRLTSTIPIVLQTAAYREKVHDSDDLGSVVDFTSSVMEGCNEYAKVLQKYANDVRVAPVGDAFLWVYHRNIKLWRTLFHTDDFHPSPHGTWLQACVLYCTMLREAPPVFQSEWFARARYMPSLHEESLPLPSMEEAEELRIVACSVCGVRPTNGVD